MDFSLLTQYLDAAAAGAVVGITALAAIYFTVDFALWAYDTVMDMLDGEPTIFNGHRIDHDDGTYSYVSQQEYEDYEYHRDRDESRGL